MKVERISLQKHGDDRGMLVALEKGVNVPFAIRRVYYMFDTKRGVLRGSHAHRHLRQLVVAVRGSVRFLIDDGHERSELVLDDPAEGVILDRMVWREMHDFSAGCVLLVLADRLYDPRDYIRDYALFRRLARGRR